MRLLPNRPASHWGEGVTLQPRIYVTECANAPENQRTLQCADQCENDREPTRGDARENDCAHLNEARHPRRRTILLVEDEPFVREATTRILESAGFHVLPTSDAQSALAAFEHLTRQIDLLMTDMVLPGQSGHKLGQSLRQLSDKLVVLMTSGYANPDLETEIPESRTYFLPKPYSKRLLIDKIEKLLRDELHRTTKQAE